MIILNELMKKKLKIKWISDFIGNGYEAYGYNYNYGENIDSLKHPFYYINKLSYLN